MSEKSKIRKKEIHRSLRELERMHRELDRRVQESSGTFLQNVNTRTARQSVRTLHRQLLGCLHHTKHPIPGYTFPVLLIPGWEKPGFKDILLEGRLEPFTTEQWKVGKIDDFQNEDSNGTRFLAYLDLPHPETDENIHGKMGALEAAYARDRADWFLEEIIRAHGKEGLLP